jgi:Porin subfamily
MKMVKSLLLGTAAGVVAVSMGQAADLPVKAKPVEYVKVCTLYGAGFYYMPGTDMCIKIGGYTRAEITDYSNGNMTQGPQQSDFNNRGTSNLTMRGRGYVTADAREQTAYGTARGYVAVGVATADIGNTQLPSILGFNRVFVQWAGITAGIAQSFYDFYSAAAVGYRAYNPSEDTGDAGWWVWAYTAQLGNGLSATISAEARRTTQMVNLSGGTAVAAGVQNTTGLSSLATALCGEGAQPGSMTGDVAIAAAANTAPLCYGGAYVPDIVGNLRVDQAWGSAQVMAVAHNDNAGYYGQQVSTTAANNFPGTGMGGPSDKWGFVVGAGLKLNFPMVAQGDYFQAEANYTQGALRYISHGNAGPTLFSEQGNKAAYGLMSDCVYGATVVVSGAAPVGGTGCNLTTGWSINASYEHYWTPQFHESFVGGYMAVRYNAQSNAMLCQYEAFGVGAAFGAAATPIAGCNNNWAVTSYGTRFQYDVTKSLYLGVEFLYNHYTSATSPTGTVGSVLAGQYNTATSTSGINATSVLGNENNLSITARIHKDFLP